MTVRYLREVPFTLKDPIYSGEEEIKEVTIREVKASDIARCGMPFSYSPDGTTEIKSDVIFELLKISVSLPPSVMDQLSMHDLFAIQQVFINFFARSEE